MQNFQYPSRVEKWDVWEVSFSGPTEGNPFTDYHVTGVFTGKNESRQVDGFYDGDGVYRVRFMPSFEGTYSFRLHADFWDEEQKGQFVAEPAKKGNHGPVRVAGTYHFAYEDGTPYYSIGTTCYVWELQSDSQIEKTLQTLSEQSFNKIRFCLFPKHYDYNLHEPRCYPFEGTPMDSSVLTPDNFAAYTGRTDGNHWDFTRPNPTFFRHVEKCLYALRERGIEADLILWHPYDRWGFSQMTREQDLFYLRYVVSRFSAFRHVWWSMANEYDLMPQKSIEDWECLAMHLCRWDPYGHLRSIHNCLRFYDHSRPWITHCSIQRLDLYKSGEMTGEWRARYQKPVVLDEIAYEGNIQHGWGNISGEELTRRFWETACRGGYAGHGETFLSPDGMLWWSHGGTLYGDSPQRLAFLHRILCETPGLGLKPYPLSWDDVCAVPENSLIPPGQTQDYYLIYYSFMRPSFRDFHFDDDSVFDVRVIDTWNMTVEERGTINGAFRVTLPAKPYMAIQLRRVAKK